MGGCTPCKQNPGERRAGESVDRQAGRYFGGDDVVAYGSPNVDRSTLEVISDAVEEGKDDQAYDLIEQMDPADRDDANDAWKQWDTKASAILWRGRGTPVEYIAFVATAPHPRTEDEIGEYLRGQGNTYATALRGEKGYSIEDASRYPLARNGRRDFMIGYWMETLHLMRERRLPSRGGIHPTLKKSNPGERAEGESLDMAAGRYFGGLQEGSLVTSIQGELEIVSDALKDGRVTEATKALGIALDHSREAHTIGGDALEKWQDAVVVMLHGGRVVMWFGGAEYGDPSRTQNMAALMEDMRQRANSISKGPWLLRTEMPANVVQASREQLVGERGTMIFWWAGLVTSHNDRSPTVNVDEFLLGFWMQSLRVHEWVQRRQRGDYTEKIPNPAPLTDKEWWDGVLAKTRGKKKNPHSKDVSLLDLDDDMRQFADRIVVKDMRKVEEAWRRPEDPAPHGWSRENVEALLTVGDAIDEGKRDVALLIISTQLDAGTGMFGLSSLDVDVDDDIRASRAAAWSEKEWDDYSIAYWSTVYTVMRESTWGQRVVSWLQHGTAAPGVLSARSWRTTPKANPTTPEGASKAVDMFQVFHKKDPTDVGEFHASFAIPSRVRLTGNAACIMYRSSKVDPETLKQPRKPIDYIHEFGKGVCLYTPGGSADQKVPDEIVASTALTLLGECLGWEVMHDGKKREAEGVPPLPELYCTPSGRALLVIQDKREILAIFWGGQLGVEGRGIVH